MRVDEVHSLAVGDLLLSPAGDVLVIVDLVYYETGSVKEIIVNRGGPDYHGNTHSRRIMFTVEPRHRGGALFGWWMWKHPGFKAFCKTSIKRWDVIGK